MSVTCFDFVSERTFFFYLGILITLELMQQVEHPLFYENLSYAANKTMYGSSCASDVT